MSDNSNLGSNENQDDLTIQKIECASCHAPLNLYSDSTKFKRCDYCEYVNYIIRKEDGSYFTSTEKTSRIKKFRRFREFQVGNIITIAEEPYLIVGAMRYSAYDSVWYEFLIINMNTKKEYYLSYEDGQYIFYYKVKESGITRDLLDGRSHITKFGTLKLMEKGKAKITRFEGEIPYLIDKGEKIEYFDGMIGDMKFSVEAVKDEFEVYFGEGLINLSSGVFIKGGKIAISDEYVSPRARAIQIIIFIIIFIILFALAGGGIIGGGLGGGGGGK